VVKLEKVGSCWLLFVAVVDKQLYAQLRLLSLISLPPALEVNLSLLHCC
jgi:hypothetical protein